MNLLKIRGIMGLCVRAGQGIFGEDACMEAVRKGQCGILLLDAGISPKTATRYIRSCERMNVPCLKIPEGLLETATGRSGMAMAVRTGAFTKQVLGCLEE